MSSNSMSVLSLETIIEIVSLLILSIVEDVVNLFVVAQIVIKSKRNLNILCFIL
jgi:hypothetical protein